MTSSIRDSGETLGATDLAVEHVGGVAGMLVRKILSPLKVGALRIELPSGAKISHVGAKSGPHADIKLHNWRLIRRLAALFREAFRGAIDR